LSFLVFIESPTSKSHFPPFLFPSRRERGEREREREKNLEEKEGAKPNTRPSDLLAKTQIDEKIVPAFDRLLLTTSTERQVEITSRLKSAIAELVDAAHVDGPFFLGAAVSLVDVCFAPWIVRLSRVLGVCRQWPDPEVGTRWERWVQAVEEDERVRKTVCGEGEYRTVYEGASLGVPRLGMAE
jgi:hypothetical protein